MAYVYLMESIRDYDTVYKIGYSINPNQRRYNVQTGNDGNVKILYTFETSHGRKLETSIQNFYSHKHKNMEWFNLDIQDVVNFIPLCQKIENNLNLLNSNINI